MTTILIVDDEQQMRELVRIMLQQDQIKTYEASNGQEALDLLAQLDIDLVLLDVMMPGKDGFDVCAEIRETSNVPVIFLTAKDADEDKVYGLRLGGDDYIVKPFSGDELLARIEAVLRRTGATQPVSVNILHYERLFLDEVARKVTFNNKRVPLTMKEFDLLHLFMKHPNIVYTREQLLTQVWSHDYEGGTRTVDTHIKTLRLKLGKEASHYIQTVWGIGYRFGCDQ
ncbi:response regulator transcription factor [Kurthia huakuii]|jgi:DNA-binding response OmpR family regulator|uniref:response regulator transcription factor n=1 Tax=Kurthia huakuii TaxID=1421019 RepID=UPI000495FB85|nr:response regulator transcription factor [Kurthia huakuii]MBM7699605.1 DNA-binding response OmpR family regulator [Kurthia huakuii]